MAYETITTMTQLKDYCKLICGYPVINIEVSDEQINQILYDSIQECWRYSYSEGSHKDYILFSTTSGTSEYSLSAYNINNVYDYEISTGLGGINSLHSNQHILLYDSWVNQGAYPGGSGPSTGMVIADYDIAMMYLQEVKRQFSVSFTTVFNPATQILKLIPTPSDAFSGVLCVYKKEAAVNLYNNVLVKKLCVGRLKKIWGLILGKYQMTLPGGGTMNGDMIHQEGIEEEKDALERFQSESDPIDFMVG